VQPLVDGDDVEGGFVPDGEFVVPGGDSAVAFEPVDAALHGVTLLVDVRIERWWPAAGVMNDRTPVILPPERIDAWLDPGLTDKTEVQKLITGIEYEPLQVRAVSTAVNKTGRGGSKGPELIEPLAGHADQPLHLVSAWRGRRADSGGGAGPAG
jgi:hypothetical protein